MAAAGWNLGVNGGATTNIAPNGTVNINQGSNILVTQSGTDITIATTPDLTANSLTIVGGPVISATGIDMNGQSITNLAPGVNPADAVNISQLNSAVTGVKTHYYSVNDGGTVGGNFNNDGATGTDALAAGVNASAVGANSTAVGVDSSAGGSEGIALGFRSAASGANSSALGVNSAASGVNSIAMGNGAQAQGDNSISVGTGNVVNGTGSGAFGDPNTITGTDSYAFGNGNTIDANNAFVLGNNVAIGAGLDDAVALGFGTSVAAPNPTASATINGITYTFAGINPTSVVSVGAVGAERQITNVAAGRVTSTSTDAINGSQLFTVADQLSSQITSTETHDYSVNSTTPGTDTNYGNAGATGSNALAAGVSASAAGDNSVALGNGAGATRIGDIAIGNGASADSLVCPTCEGAIAIGVNANATNDGLKKAGIAIGDSAQSKGVAVGDHSQADTDGTAIGISATAFVNATAMGTAAHAGGTESTAIGTNARALADFSTAIGFASHANNSKDVALGFLSQTAPVIATSTVTINGVTYTVAGTTPAATVSVGGNLFAPTRTITNVAAGRVSATSTDAVNGSELFATNQAVTAVAGQLTHDYSVNSTTPGTDSNYGNAGATGSNALAAGVSASATATDAAAVGNAASATIDGAVALGAGSVSDRVLAPGSGVIGGTFVPYNTSDLTLLGAVSVGSSTSYRQITNVADATQASDAVTLRQLTGALTSFATTTTKYFHANSTLADSLAVGNNSIAVGPTTVVNGDNGVGMGYGALVQQTAPGGVAIGQNATSNQADSIALGTQATASGIQSVSLGAGSSTTTPTSVAVGSGASAGAQAGDVALGANSTTAGVVGTSGTTIGGTAYNFAGANPTSTVSVGSVGNERTITNVAAGRISATSTDAVNGSELNATNQQVTANTSAINNLSSSVNNNIKYYQANSTGPAGSATGSDAVAAGPSANASGDNSTAIGVNSTSTGTNSVALGAGSVANQDNTVSVGSAGNERKITNVAAGTAPTDAVNVSQLKASQQGGVQYDSNPDGSVDYTSVTLNPGGDAAVVHNVATGVASDDAVNVGQMNTAIAGAVTTANNYTDQRFNELKGNLSQVGNRANAGIASAIAAASLPQPYAPNQSSLGVGLGSFHGETGIAVGLSKISESGRFILKANVSSDTRGDFGAGVGAGIVW